LFAVAVIMDIAKESEGANLAAREEADSTEEGY
jgi:hypothetical protein